MITYQQTERKSLFAQRDSVSLPDTTVQKTTHTHTRTHTRVGKEAIVDKARFASSMRLFILTTV